MQLITKDQCSQTNKNFYRVLLYSHGPEYGQDFFKEPMTPCNLYAKENEKKLEAFEKQLRNLVRFNVWCHTILERKNSYFVIRNTKICT